MYSLNSERDPKRGMRGGFFLDSHIISTTPRNVSNLSDNNNRAYHELIQYSSCLRHPTVDADFAAAWTRERAVATAKAPSLQAIRVERIIAPILSGIALCPPSQA